MIRSWKAPIFFMVVCLAAEAAYGGGAPYVPICQMISEAEAVAVCEITEIEEIELPSVRPKVWLANRDVALTPLRVLRGKLPKEFRAKVRSNRHQNASAASGSKVLVFVGEGLYAKRSKLPQGYLPVFDEAQGFKVVSDLAFGKDDGKAAEEIRAAIEQAIANYRPQKPRRCDGRWALNIESIRPLVSLLRSDREVVRLWALRFGLERLCVGEFVGDCVVSAMADEKRTVQIAAAQYLMESHYWAAAESLDAFAEELSEAEPKFVQQIRSFVKHAKASQSHGSAKDQ